MLNGLASIVSLRVAVVGCGRWGSHHLAALVRLQDQLNIEHIVACDTDLDVAQSLRLSGFCVHENVESLVEEHQVDAVIVATPNNTHYALGKMFLEQGVHALVEKPLSVEHDLASSLVSISVEKGKVLKCFPTNQSSLKSLTSSHLTCKLKQTKTTQRILKYC